MFLISFFCPLFVVSKFFGQHVSVSFSSVLTVYSFDHHFFAGPLLLNYPFTPALDQPVNVPFLTVTIRLAPITLSSHIGVV